MTEHPNIEPGAVDPVARRAELAAIMQARPADAATLERMVYGPTKPIDDDTRAVIAEWFG